LTHDSCGARGAVHAPPQDSWGPYFLFFRFLSKVENLSLRKKMSSSMFTTLKSKTHKCISKLCFIGGGEGDITYLKISPTFVLFGHVVRCFLQYLSLVSILCTSKYIYYLILHLCCQKRCKNTMFLQNAIAKCIFLSRISNPICICMELLLDYPLWNYKVESRYLTN